jgi:hypothetical protein
MAKDYQRLWTDITRTIDEGKAVRTLVEILVDEEGRTFILQLGRRDAELCIEILDHVSRDPYPLPSFTASDGLVRVLQNTTSKSQRSKLSSSR